MKKIILVFVGLALSTIFILAIIPVSKVNLEYLRIHIRANSNDGIDQNIKYKVKESVVSYLTPVLTQCDTKDKTISKLEIIMSDIEEVCNNTLIESGFSYKVKASIKREEFPARAYDNLMLDAGIYDALIIEIGEALGDNWWCVVYPPFCFINSTDNGRDNIRYRSKLIEIIENFKNNR